MKKNKMMSIRAFNVKKCENVENFFLKKFRFLSVVLWIHFSLMWIRIRFVK